MNLSEAKDRDHLMKTMEPFPLQYELLQANLENYVRLFPWLQFYTVYNGGFLSFQTADNNQILLQLEDMLRFTGELLKLEKYPRFDKLMEGFQNPTQVMSTMFEAQVALWASSRKASRGLTFSPEVLVKGATKLPEFVWHTSLGDIYCECKREGSLNNNANRRIHKLFNVLGNAYEEHAPWGDSVRLDMNIQHPALNGTEKLIRDLVKKLAFEREAGTSHIELVEKVVSVKLCQKSAPVPDVAGCLQIQHRVLVNSDEPLISNNAQYTLTMSLMAYRVKQLGNLVRDARSQLPADQPGAIFIDIGRSQLFVEKIQKLIAQPEYANTPIISLWEGSQPLFATCRTGQPLDGRLFE